MPQDPDSKLDPPSDNVSEWIDLLSDWPDDLTKHYVFMHYGLRAGSTWECFRMAHAMREQPLPRHAMQHIAAKWAA
jgi:hypothetical protein